MKKNQEKLRENSIGVAPGHMNKMIGGIFR